MLASITIACQTRQKSGKLLGDIHSYCNARVSYSCGIWVDGHWATAVVMLARLVRRWRSFAASGRSERAPSSGPPFSHPSKKKNKFHASHVVTSALAWAARSAGQAITHPPCDDLAWSDVLLLSSKHIVAFQSRRPHSSCFWRHTKLTFAKVIWIGWNR